MFFDLCMMNWDMSLVPTGRVWLKGLECLGVVEKWWIELLIDWELLSSFKFISKFGG